MPDPINRAERLPDGSVICYDAAGALLPEYQGRYEVVRHRVALAADEATVYVRDGERVEAERW